MDSALLAFAVVFLAELGDKSQLMTLTFATRYRPVTVLAGITAATAAMNGLSVLAGGLVGTALPPGPVAIAAGLAFFGFAVWTIRGDHHDHGDDTVGRSGIPVLAVAVTFLLAEFGDKTMLATATLATTRNGLGVWAGATAGMVGANIVAILVGHHLGDRIPERWIKRGAAAAFAAFGLWLLIDGYRQV
ncbi:MAG: TMEM165/GDT1 family protein [Acidimicrobiia bacterium]